MIDWFKQTIIRAESLQDGLSEWRQPSLALLKQTPWPTRKTEAWKYTPLRAIERFATADVVVGSSPNLQAILDYDCLNIVFVDGRFDATQSTAVFPAGMQVRLLADTGAQVSTSLFNTIKPTRHLFGLINDVLAQDVIEINVDPGITVEKPLRITSIMSPGAEAHMRLLVRVGAGATLSVSEHYEGHAHNLQTGFIEYDVQEKAKLEHYRFVLQTQQSLHLGGNHFCLAAHSTLNSCLVGFGSELARVDTDIIYQGEQASAKLNAFYLLDGKALLDLHTTVEHKVPSCTTLENVRGIVADEARSVFNGRIHIHRYAQKTLAELNNRNLLLSDKAEVNTKPELEIYADDVRCAHGATIAEIDKQALYYLQSRGIDQGKAQVMLNFGFINELIDEMPNRALAEWIRPLIRDRFASMKISR